MRTLLVPLLTVMAWGAPAFLRADAPSIESAAPGIGRRGSEFELKFFGANLADAEEVMLYSPGIACLGVKAVSENELIARFRSEPDCPLGSHAYRVRTKGGLSELRIFRITPFPLVAAEEPNQTPADAQRVAANVTITGVLEAGDVDDFRMTLRRGERLAAEVEAMRLGGRMLDTIVTVIGPDGSTIAASDDTALFKQDPFVTIVAPEDGDYVVQVREVNFDGDENSRYALHLGTFPRPTFVYPAGGPANQKLTVRFHGDAAGEFDQEIQLPGADQPDFGLFAMQNGIASPTANPFRISPFGNVQESEANDQPAGATGPAAELPRAFNGIIERPGDKDCFRFRAAAGVRYQFESFASRLGLPPDTIISITEMDGTLLVSNDDDGSHDSRLIFSSPRDGEFALCVTDKRGSGGEDFVYRVEATEYQPRVTPFLPRPNRISQENQVVMVPRGNRVLVKLGVVRSGAPGDVRLVATGLPPGVVFPEAIVPKDRFWIPVVVDAQTDAPFAGTLADLRAAVPLGDSELRGKFVQVVDLVSGPADGAFHTIAVDRLAVAVVDESPISVTLEAPRTVLAQDGTIGLTVRVDRAKGFDGPVDVTFPFLPPWVDGEAKITIPADKATAVYTAHAFPQAEARIWPICAEAKAGAPSARRAVEGAPGGQAGGQGGGGRYGRGRGRSRTPSSTAVASSLVTLQVAESPVIGTIGTVAAQQGSVLSLVCELKRQGTLPDQMTATLEGLPNRVSASPVKVSRDEPKVTFSVKFEETAPIGSFPSLLCRLTGEVEGQPVSYAVGRGGVLRIDRAGALVVDEAGRPLSPLEVLRRKEKQKDNKDGKPRAP